MMSLQILLQILNSLVIPSSSAPEGGKYLKPSSRAATENKPVAMHSKPSKGDMHDMLGIFAMKEEESCLL